jgi:hypothetical protein
MAIHFWLPVLHYLAQVSKIFIDQVDFILKILFYFKFREDH